MKRGWYQLFYSEYKDILATLGKGASDGDLLDYLNSQTGNKFTWFEVLDAPIEFRRL